MADLRDQRQPRRLVAPPIVVGVWRCNYCTQFLTECACNADVEPRPHRCDGIEHATFLDRLDGWRDG